MRINMSFIKDLYSRPNINVIMCTTVTMVTATAATVVVVIITTYN